MLEKALFRKHTKLILYMAERKYFSQKELIEWSLSHNEFKDKDSIENKGQFRDKLISYGLLKKYSFKEFKNLYPNELTDACKAYTESMERKRCILLFNSDNLIGLDYPTLAVLKLPFQTYAAKLNKNNLTYSISDTVKAFVFGCSIQKILLFNEKFSGEMKLLANARDELSEELLPLVELARDAMEENIREKVRNKNY